MSDETACKTETAKSTTKNGHWVYNADGVSPSDLDAGTILRGRKPIYTDQPVITRENVLDVLQKSVLTHNTNRSAISYLYNYYKGAQPILDRVKSIRPDICNKVIENHANEIVSFKTGYLFGDPVAYAGRAEDDCAEAIKELNRYMSAENKETQDTELANWFHICGTAYRIVLPKTDGDAEDESPFDMATLDPRDTFIVRYTDIKKKPVMAVTYVEFDDPSKETVYSIYTPTRYFEVTGDEITVDTANPMGMIPIIEYPLNQARIGAFEIVLPLLNALNDLASDRMDGVEQFVQSLILFHNVDVSEDDVQKLSEMGAIKYKDVDATMPGDVKYITAELNQGGSQTLKDDLYESVIIITGMPNRNGGSSTSDTGSAVVLRDGWSSAETRAKETEKYFTRSEREMLKRVLHICRELNGMELHLSNVEIKFTRRNYENAMSKASVLTAMLQNNHIAPRLAFVHSGMFTDPESAYAESEAYYEAHKDEIAEESEYNRNYAGLSIRASAN